MRSFKRLVSIVVTLMLAILGGEVFVPAARAEQAYPIALHLSPNRAEHGRST